MLKGRTTQIQLNTNFNNLSLFLSVNWTLYTVLYGMMETKKDRFGNGRGGGGGGFAGGPCRHVPPSPPPPPIHQLMLCSCNNTSTFHNVRNASKPYYMYMQHRTVFVLHLSKPLWPQQINFILVLESNTIL